MAWATELGPWNASPAAKTLSMLVVRLRGVNLQSISLGDLQSFAAAKEAHVRLFTDCKNNCFRLNAFLCTRYAARRTCFPAAMAGQASS